MVNPREVIAGAVENILVRLPGSDPEGAILIIAHYDSTPGGSGAGDNGSGVVTLLEILRALKAGPQLRQDVIAFFTDGHEPGIIGTNAFVAQHPWFADVKLVINMDVLRNGPVIINRSNQGNGNWIPALTSTAAKPAHLSFPYDLFTGGDNDLIPFQESGIPGLSFIGATPGLEHHTTLDLPEAVRPGTVQQTGNQVLAMVRTIGDQPTFTSTVPDQTHFPVLGSLVRYPASWAVPLAGVAGLSLLGTIFYGFRKKNLAWKGLGLGFITGLISIILSVLLVGLLWLGIQALHPEYQYSTYRPHLSDNYLYFIGFLLLALLVASASIAIARRKVSALDLATGTLVIWLSLDIAFTMLYPATSYLSTWVLLSGSLAVLFALAVESKRNAWFLSSMGFLLAAILASFLWVPLIYIAFCGGPMASGITTLSIAMAAAAVLFVSLIPVMDWATDMKHWLLPAAATLGALGFLFAGHLLVGRDSPGPMHNSIGYWLDADGGETSWIAFIGGHRMDAHTTTEYQVAFPEDMDERQIGLLVDPVRRPYTDLFPKAPPFSVLTSEAPALALDGPRLEVLADEWVNTHRVVDIRFTASMHDRLYIIIPEEAAIMALTVPHNDRTEFTAMDGGELVLRLDGMPIEGIEIRFEFSGKAPIQFLLVEEKTGLPSFPGLATQADPGRMQSPGEFYQGIPTDFTAINRNFIVQAMNR